eukprot:2224273-Pleurochrysis_carterae.AAC.1
MRWLQPNTRTFDSVGGIQVGNKVLLRHAIVKYAAMLKKHGYSPLRAFELLRLCRAQYNALRVDTRSAGIQPIVKMTSCKRAPEDWWIFDESSLTSGTFAAPATTVAVARGNPYELGGQIRQPELSRGDAPWIGYDTSTIQPELSSDGSDVIALSVEC